MSKLISYILQIYAVYCMSFKPPIKLNKRKEPKIKARQKKLFGSWITGEVK